MNLRPRIALLSCLTALGAAGTTGALLVAESRAHAAEELKQKQLLLVQNRAFALGYNLELASRELTRLSQMAEVDLSDNDLKPEAALLAHAHRNSTLFNIGLQILDAAGRCLWSEPASPNCQGHTFAGADWFQAGLRADDPVVMGERTPDGETHINLVVPIGGRRGAAAGVLRGIIDLRSDRVISPALTGSLPEGTQAALVAPGGVVLYPSRLDGWQRAVAAAPRVAEAFVESERGTSFLYAHAPVTQAGWGLVFRWPYSALDDGLLRLVKLLTLLLVLGAALAVLLGLFTSRFLTEPLNGLVQAVRRLGLTRGQPDTPPPASVVKVAARSDELGELARAFHELQARLRAGDELHREDLERIRELAASLEERVRARTAELEAAQRSLLAQERLAAMGQAAAVISHELKNSLGAIGMGVDLIATESRASEGLQRVHAQVRTEVTRLRGLTDELLVFARSPRIDRRRVDLQELLRTALALCAEQAQSASVTLIQEPGAPLFAGCDAERIQSVLVNLIQNAIEAVAWRSDGKADPRREVRVSARPPAPGGPALASIEIEDSGPGLEGGASSHLFEPFFTTKRNGTGLGLATAQRFVSAHGGRIELLPGAALAGARFAVLLPLDEPAGGAEAGKAVA
jgi:signal transduction histidine kinase